MSAEQKKEIKSNKCTILDKRSTVFLSNGWATKYDITSDMILPPFRAFFPSKQSCPIEVM